MAAYVASGMADVSFGVETAARRFEAHPRGDAERGFDAAMAALPDCASGDAGIVKPVQGVFRKAD